MIKIDFPFLTSYKVQAGFHIIVTSSCNDRVFVKVGIVIIIFVKSWLFSSDKDLSTSFCQVRMNVVLNF